MRYRLKDSLRLFVTAAWIAVLCAAVGSSGCEEAGVIPPELKALGSLGSATYTARHLYPENGVELEVMRPRVGTPALLSPEEQSLSVTVYVAPGLDATDLQLSAVTQDDARDTYTLPLESPPVCDPDGICAVRAVVDSNLPFGQMFELCAELQDRTVCRRGAVVRFAEVPDPLRLVHITDLHLFGTAFNPRLAERFEKLLEAAESRSPRPDVVVVTGDIGHYGRRAEQQYFADTAGRSTLPVVAIPGNHDFKEGNIVHYLNIVTPHLDHVTRLGPYVLVGLNTGPGKFDESHDGPWGESVGLERSQVDWLSGVTAAADQVEAVMTHNPPYSVYWSVIGNNRKHFMRICKRNNVRVILSGHTHVNEVYDREGVGQGLDIKCESNVPSSRMPVTLITARSTEYKTAGFRLVNLFADGRVSYCWKYVSLR